MKFFKSGKNRKSISLFRYLAASYGVFAGITLTLLILLLSLGIVYLVNRSEGILLALSIILPITVLLILASAVVTMRGSYRVLYENLYSITRKNYQSLREDRRELLRYNASKISEFSELNDAVNELSTHYANSDLISLRKDYKKIPLEYYDKRNNFLNEKTFKNYIREIIYNSQSHRNAVISVTFDKDAELNGETIKEIISMTLANFTNPLTLLALKQKGNGIFIYLPQVESLSLLREELENYLQKIVSVKTTISGIELISPKINAVVYPYSKIEDLFSDLEFAERQGNGIHIYIPRRIDNIANTSLFQNSLNFSNVMKMVSNLSSITENEGDFEDFLQTLSKSIKEIIAYLDIDQGGLILFDKEKRKTGGSICVTKNEKQQPIFKKLSAVKEEFVDAIIDGVDEDNSFYFSSRKMTTALLGRQFDIYDISSGFIYCIKNLKGDFIGAIYFFNTNKKEMPLNNYLIESLLVLSNMMSVFVKNALGNIKIAEMKNREDNLMKMTNIRSYIIDKDTYEIVSYSPSLKADFPNLKEGKICYKEMFGFDAPCANCPLSTKQKIIKDISNSRFEVSNSIDTRISNHVELILNKIDDDSLSTNRFDPDLLINTYYSFIERLKNLYLARTKGYIVLLNIDNMEELISKLGNEGYLFLLRSFSSEINNKLLKNGELYIYKNNTLAIIYSEIGKLDAVDNIEKIYEYSKHDYLKSDEKINLNITYEAIKFPQEHSDVNDLIRRLELVNKSYSSNISKDIMYIEENDYTRPASREEYILSIINQATVAKSFIIKAQPVIRGENKTIAGAEILVRLSDEYRASLLNTEEMISVAARHDKLNIISDMLIDYVGNLVKQFGYSIFKTSGFNRMSINADFNYFRDENMRSKIVASVMKYHFPKNFLTFEIAEKDFADHYDDMKEVIDQLRANDINVVVDHYTGAYLSFERVKALGCDEIKVDRRVLSDIDVITEKFDALKALIQSAETQNVQMTLVGVENGRQYELVKQLNPRLNIQGYYFHHPLDQNELIEAIRVNG